MILRGDKIALRRNSDVAYPVVATTFRNGECVFAVETPEGFPMIVFFSMEDVLKVWPRR